MPYRGGGKGEPFGEDGSFMGTSGVSIDDAIRAAVDAARQPQGTWFHIGTVAVESVDDPNVGGYKVIITPGSEPGA